MHAPAARFPRHSLSRRHALTLGAAGIAFGRGLSTAHAAEYPTTWTFGDVTISKVVDMVGPYSAAKSYPGAPLEAFTENASWLVPHFYDPVAQNVLFSYHAYLVRTPHHIIVVDGGHGNDKVRRSPETNMRHGPFLDNLRAAGVTPEQVNFVINTHFDSDHVGWNTRLVDEKLVPTYPNARYLFQRKEVDSVAPGVTVAPGAASSVGDSIQPILESKLVEYIDGDHQIEDGVRIVFAPGHTPGHQTLAINSKGRRAILAGDILHNPIEALHPEWICMFDHDKEAGLAQRIKFVEANTDVDVTVFAAHFGGPTAGKIVSKTGGKRWFKTLAA